MCILTDCPLEWELNYDLPSCYFINTTYMSYPLASSTCQISGGHLAVISSDAENSWILTKLRAKAQIDNWRAWIGYDDRPTEGQFERVEQIEEYEDECKLSVIL